MFLHGRYTKVYIIIVLFFLWMWKPWKKTRGRRKQRGGGETGIVEGPAVEGPAVQDPTNNFLNIPWDIKWRWIIYVVIIGFMLLILMVGIVVTGYYLFKKGEQERRSEWEQTNHD